MFYGMGNLNQIEEAETMGSRHLGYLGAKKSKDPCRQAARKLKGAERKEKAALKKVERLNKQGVKANERLTKCKARGRACRGQQRKINNLMKRAVKVADKYKEAAMNKAELQKSVASCGISTELPFVPFQSLPDLQTTRPETIATEVETPILPGPLPGTLSVTTPTGTVTLPDTELPGLMAAGGTPMSTQAVAPVGASNAKNFILLAGIAVGALGIGWFVSKQKRKA